VAKNKVLTSIEPILNDAKRISINLKKVKQFCERFQRRENPNWLGVSPFDLSILNPEQKLNFLFVLNSISFSYWGRPKWTVKYDGLEFDGAKGMIAGLARAITNGIQILNPSYLSEITQEQLEEILKGNVTISLIKERREILNELGKKTLQTYSGKFSKIVEKAGGDALEFVEIMLDEFPSFGDYSKYRGKDVYFNKRSQLLASDISRLFPGLLDKNANQLTACADYKLPQVLRRFGIFEYDEELSKKIDNQFEISKGSFDELEIRAKTIQAVEIIKGGLETKIPEITSAEINDYLWIAGQMKMPEDRPYHLTRTTSY